MEKYLGFVAVSMFLFSCAEAERNNPYDERAYNYIGKASVEGSSSSVETDNYPSSSSVALSSSSVVQSSSSAPPSSSSAVPSSNSVAPSSSSAPPSSSSVAVSSSSVVPLSGSSGTFVDERNSKTYKWVKIGTHVWMAENLNYVAEGSKCFGEGGTSKLYDEEIGEYITKTLSDAEVQSNCAKYGRLYDWATAMELPNCSSDYCRSQIQDKHRGICPSGWHIPSNNEFNVLMIVLDGSSTAGTKLKAVSGWDDNYNGVSGNGTDDYAFSALPGGYGDSGGSFFIYGRVGYWWLAHDSNDSYGNKAYCWGMASEDSYVSVNYSAYKSLLFSVRCVHD